MIDQARTLVAELECLSDNVSNKIAHHILEDSVEYCLRAAKDLRNVIAKADES